MHGAGRELIAYEDYAAIDIKLSYGLLLCFFNQTTITVPEIGRKNIRGIIR